MLILSWTVVAGTAACVYVTLLVVVPVHAPHPAPGWFLSVRRPLCAADSGRLTAEPAWFLGVPMTGHRGRANAVGFPSSVVSGHFRPDRGCEVQWLGNPSQGKGQGWAESRVSSLS